MNLWTSLVFTLIFTWLSHSQSAETIKVVVDEWPPYSFVENGIQKGTDIEILRAVGKNLNIDVQFKFVPWKRALAMVASGRADGIISLYNTPKRQSFLIYPSAAISSEEIVVIAQKGKAGLITDLKSLHGKQVCVNADTSYGEAFDRDNEIFKIDCKSSISAMKIVSLGRTPYALINRSVLQWHLKENPDIKNLEVEPFRLNKQDLFIGFSKKLYENKTAFVNRFSAEINKLRSSGEIDLIQRKYLSVK